MDNEQLILKLSLNASRALDDIYHYGFSKSGSFGQVAMFASINYGLIKIREINDLEDITIGMIEDIDFIDAVSDSIHAGWSTVAKTFNDPIYIEKPEKKEQRLALANTDYYDLSNDEQEKDRVIARSLVKDFVKIKENMI